MKIKKSGKFFKSLRFRILIILIILGIVPSVIVTEMVIANYEDRAIANRVQSMENICDIMCDLLIKENYLNDSSSQTVNSKLELLSNIYGGRILIVDRDFRIIKDTYGVDEGKTLVSQKVVNCFKGEDAYRYDSDSQKLILAVPVKSPEVNQVQGAMMIMASSSEVTSTIRELEQKGILIIGIIVVLAIFLGYILSTVLVKPFARVTKAIEDLTDGYQNEEISVPDYTETALITDAFNKMLSRMKTLDESRQEFVSNVSHELKTPMTSIIGYADTLYQKTLSPEEVHQLAGIIMNEGMRLEALSFKLMELVTLSQSNFQLEEARIDEVIADAVETIQPTAEKRNVRVQLQTESAWVRLEYDLFKTLLLNLMDNALKSGTDRINIQGSCEKEQYMISIRDYGRGIPKEDLQKITEAFYMVDKSRSRKEYGAGLGLALAVKIAKLHQTELVYESVAGQGTCVSFMLAKEADDEEEEA